MIDSSCRHVVQTNLAGEIEFDYGDKVEQLNKVLNVAYRVIDAAYKTTRDVTAGTASQQDTLRARNDFLAFFDIDDDGANNYLSNPLWISATRKFLSSCVNIFED